MPLLLLLRQEMLGLHLVGGELGIWLVELHLKYLLVAMQSLASVDRVVYLHF
jgi:hypothetical protein